MGKERFTWISKESDGIRELLVDISAEIKQLSKNIDEFIKEYKNEWCK